MGEIGVAKKFHLRQFFVNSHWRDARKCLKFGLQKLFNFRGLDPNLQVLDHADRLTATPSHARKHYVD